MGAQACDAPAESKPAGVMSVAQVPPKSRKLGKFCHGGLLCEDPDRLLGYRVPWICSNRQVSTYLARCSMRHLDWRLVVEFYRSRYADMTLTDGRLEIVGTRGVAGPEAVTPASKPGTQAPTLLVQRLANAIEITAVRGD